MKKVLIPRSEKITRTRRQATSPGWARTHRIQPVENTAYPNTTPTTTRLIEPAKIDQPAM